MVFITAILATVREALSESSQDELEKLEIVQELIPAAEAALTPYEITPSTEAKTLCGNLPDGATDFSDALRFIATGQYKDAEKALGRAETTHQVEPYRILRLRGLIEVYRGQYVKAHRWYLQAARDNPNSLTLGDELWEVLLGTGELAAAGELLESIIETKIRLARDEDHTSVAFSVTHLADTHAELTEYDRALSLIQKARKTQEQAEGSLSPSLIPILEVEADALAELDKIEQAHQVFERLREIVLREHGKQSVEYVEYLNNHAILYNATGNPERALLLHNMAKLLAEQFLPENHYARGIILANIGMVYHATGDSENAVFNLRHAHSILSSSLGIEHPNAAIVQVNLGRSLTGIEHFDEARRTLRAARTSLERSVGKSHLYYGYAETALGVIARKEGDYSTALQHYQVALKNHMGVFGARPNNDTATVLSDIAAAESSMERFEDAEVHIRQALAMAESLLGADNPELLAKLVNLGVILEGQNKLGEARRAFKRALEVGGEDSKYAKAIHKKIAEIDKKAGHS